MVKNKKKDKYGDEKKEIKQARRRYKKMKKNENIGKKDRIKKI